MTVRQYERSKIHVFRVPERKEEKHGAEKNIRGVMAKKSPNVAKDINLQIQETQ